MVQQGNVSNSRFLIRDLLLRGEVNSARDTNVASMAKAAGSAKSTVIATFGEIRSSPIVAANMETLSCHDSLPRKCDTKYIKYCLIDD